MCKNNNYGLFLGMKAVFQFINSSHLLSAYCVRGTMPSALRMLLYLVITNYEVVITFIFLLQTKKFKHGEAK